MKSDISVSYVLYSHYCPKDDPIDFFRSHLAGLNRLLDNSRYPGILFLFYDPGWTSLLNTVGVDFDPDVFADEFARARYVQSMLHEVLADSKMREAGRTLRDRIRILTASDLCPIINMLRGDLPGMEGLRLRQFLDGSSRKLMYDSPKVVEAIIRIRHVGSGIPVLRLDWDALFNEDTLYRLLPVAVIHAVDNYRECQEDYRVHSFMFSAGYETPSATFAEWSVEDWLRAFATRPYPAFLALPELVNSTADVANKELCKALDQDLFVRYYGLDPDNPARILTRKDRDDTRYPAHGITLIGSHPLSAVVSGALLCISDSAILDLPPFSNFRQNVMWIDDHLKYSLHRELNHFSQHRLTGSLGQIRHARLADCTVTKARPRVGTVGKYVFGSYLPTVLWGTIMDAWIQPDAASKVTHFAALARRPEPGPLVRFLEQAIRRGRCLDPRETMEHELLGCALKRINLVRKEWLELTAKREGSDSACHSFASAWASGQTVVQPLFKDDVCKTLTLNDDWVGWGMTDSFIPTDIHFDELRPAIREGLSMLIEDALQYIDWTLDWPRIVQGVRALSRGRLAIDVSFGLSSQ